MKTKVTPEEVEKESLKDLKIIVEKSKEWKIDLVVIGGYAVRAFTNAYRHTKDIDMAISKEKIGGFKALLKDYLGYQLRDTDFGLAASKRYDSDFIDVHISVGTIYDMSTGLSYPVTQELFDESNIMQVGTRYKTNKQFETKVPIVDLNTLMILKSMPKGRPEKDAIDIASLILDQQEKMSVSEIAKKCNKTKLIDHIHSQIQDFAKNINNGSMVKTWSAVTGTSLSGIQRKNIQKFLRLLDKGLKGRK